MKEIEYSIGYIIFVKNCRIQKFNGKKTIRLSLEENHSQETSLPEERNNSEASFKLDESQKLIINKDLTLFFDKDCSLISLTPIIQTNKIDYLFKLYKIYFSKKMK